MNDLSFKAAVALTKRDLDLLEDLYQKTVMSFRQVWRWHFEGLAKPTVINRLTKLQNSGLIKRLRVPKFLVADGTEQVLVVYQISKSGIQVLQKRTFNEVLRDEPVKLHAHSVDHDVKLSCVMDRLGQRFPKIIHGKHFEKYLDPTDPRPDAVMICANGEKPVAIELETTLKSFERYREIILKYRLSKTFDRVVYVSATEPIEQKLTQAITNQSAKMEQRPMTGKFYFSKLSELLVNPNAIIANGENNLTNGGEQCQKQTKCF